MLRTNKIVTMKVDLKFLVLNNSNTINTKIEIYKVAIALRTANILITTNRKSPAQMNIRFLNVKYKYSDIWKATTNINPYRIWLKNGMGMVQPYKY